MPSPHPSSRTASSPTGAPRRGFSLVELLVVLAIIATMAGLVLGGLFRTRDGNRLLAAEQVLADAIRQGRHTARSSGSPVELRLTPTLSNGEVVGTRLAGVSRVCLWSETFDKVRDSSALGSLVLPEPNGTDPDNGVVIGRSGNGRRPSLEHPIPAQELERGATLVRGTRSDGFYLACSVNPPASPAPGMVLPLLLISSSGRAVISQCALALQARELRIQTGSSATAVVMVWDLVGLVHDASGMETSVNSALDLIHRRAPNETLPSGANDLPQPIIGGRWSDVGLLYDGKRMVLYCDGQRIAEQRTGVPATLNADGSFIHLGALIVPTPTDPDNVLYSIAPLDDARLYRLGSADISELPGNVVLVSADGAKPDPALAYRILCQPDGRVEVSRDDDSDTTPINDRVTALVGGGPHAGDTATITISQLRTPGTIQSAQLTVTLDGHVSSRLVTQPVAGGGEP